MPKNKTKSQWPQVSKALDTYYHSREPQPLPTVSPSKAKEFGEALKKRKKK